MERSRRGRGAMLTCGLCLALLKVSEGAGRGVAQPGSSDWFWPRWSMVHIHSHRPFFLSHSQSLTLPLLLLFFRQFSVHSVQLSANRTRIRTVLPIFCGTPRPP